MLKVDEINKGRDIGELSHCPAGATSYRDS